MIKLHKTNTMSKTTERKPPIILKGLEPHSDNTVSELPGVDNSMVLPSYPDIVIFWSAKIKKRDSFDSNSVYK